MLDLMHGFIDVEPIGVTSERARDVLADVFRVAGGRFNIGDVIGARSVLDLGMGVGGLGVAVRELDNNIVLVGVDDVRYQMENAYPTYGKLHVPTDATSSQTWKKLGRFSLIISKGLPPGAINWLVENKTLLDAHLEDGGKAVFITDCPVDTEGFSVFHGDMHMDKNILVRRKSK